MNALGVVHADVKGGAVSLKGDARRSKRCRDADPMAGKSESEAVGRAEPVLGFTRDMTRIERHEGNERQVARRVER